MVDKNSSYRKGKRWGFAVMSVDKAMTTCARYARTGMKKGKKLNSEERSAYRGIADGIYEFVKKTSRR